MMNAMTLLMIMLLGLSACMSVEPRMRTRSAEAEAAAQLVQSAERLSSDLAREDLLKALGVFEAMDDRSGRWSALNALAAWHLARRETAMALEYSQQAFDLASQLKSTPALYTSALQLGQLTGDQGLFRKALPHARTGLEKAVLHVLLNEQDLAEAELKNYRAAEGGGGHTAEQAFVLYHLGKHEGDKNLILEALDQYRLAGDPFGVTDSLFLVATLERSPAAARELAERALLAARQTGDTSRVTAISRWLESKGSQQ